MLRSVNSQAVDCSLNLKALFLETFSLAIGNCKMIYFSVNNIRVVFCLALIFSLALIGNSYAAESVPNVVLIYGDDVGYADVGINGATQIPTPHIDSLAAQSLNFSDGHCSASTCTPSRFSLLTGVHAFRFGVRIAPPNEPLLIPIETYTLPKLFKQAGYQTGIVGKWHLGLGTKADGPDWNGELKPGPLEVGFDSAFLMPTTNDRVPCVYIEGHRVVNHDPNDLIYVGNKLSDVNKEGSTQYPLAKDQRFYRSSVCGHGRIGYMSGGKSALWNDKTMTDVFVNKAKEYLAANKEKPFFLMYSAQDIHIPNMPNDRFKGRTKLGKRGDAMVQLDWAVGELLAELDKHQLNENTIVIFTSDNGPTQHDDSYGPSRKNNWKNAPKRPKHDASGKWRGGKYGIYEGGTRVPFMIRWPNHIEPNTSNALVNQIDFLASFAELFDIELAEEVARDSRSTLAAFLGKDKIGLPYMIEESGGVALRVGDWKYVPAKVTNRGPRFSPVVDSLFDLNRDPGEQDNLIGKYPDRANEMAAQLKALMAP